MSSVLGKILRVSLIIVLIAIMCTTLIMLVLQLTASILNFARSFDITAYSSFVFSLVYCLPIDIICIISIILVALQTKRVVTLEKLVLKADNIPNDFRFTPPNTSKSKKPIILKVVIFAILIGIAAVCIIGMHIAFMQLLLDIIYIIGILYVDLYISFDALIMLTYIVLFVLILVACSLGGASIFIGGRRGQVNELESVLIQKSQFAEIRAKEENEDFDELDQIF
ncbi:MAG: hypothetical protein IJ437_00410 [Clostridia bacterium]|nr:hypothetical protein [Clostridia bacterium]